MGLPLYRPSPSPEPAENAEKTAAQARSSIRRRRSPPASREDRSQESGLSREVRRGPWEINGHTASQAAFVRMHSDRNNRRRRQQQTLDEGNDHRLRASIDSVFDGPSITADTETYESGYYSRQRRRLDDTEAALRSLRESREDIARLQALLAEPPRSSNADPLRAPRSHNSSSQTQNLNMLTTPSDSSTTSRVPSPQLPANRGSTASPPRASTSSRPPSRPASILAELPPLSRVSAHPNISRLPHVSLERYRVWRDNRNRRTQNRLDGLGDRERSVSSEGDGIWDPLVASMTPDPQPASASSSFASASAAASISSRSNAGTTSTSMTTIGDNDVPANPEVCESENSGEDQCEENTAEEDMDIFEADDDESYVRSLIQPEVNHYISYADVISNPRAHRMQHRASTSDFQTVDRWQPIILALSRREDIPDEWWAEAGLMRILQDETLA